MTDNFTRQLADEHATEAFGVALAKTLPSGMSNYLHGQLGAGKTTLVRGVLHGLGYQGKVKSPTYTLVEPYQSQDWPFQLYHFDLYRFQDEEEWHAAGFREYFNPNSVCFVEWPEKAGHLIPRADLDIYLELIGTGRQIKITANTELAKQCLSSL